MAQTEDETLHHHHTLQKIYLRVAYSINGPSLTFQYPTLGGITNSCTTPSQRIPAAPRWFFRTPNSS